MIVSVPLEGIVGDDALRSAGRLSPTLDVETPLQALDWLVRFPFVSKHALFKPLPAFNDGSSRPCRVNVGLNTRASVTLRILPVPSTDAVARANPPAGVPFTEEWIRSPAYDDVVWSA